MRKAFLIGVSFMFVILFAGMTASAALVSMDFYSTGGNSSGGVYVYPYNFNINGSAQTYPLMCDDFTHMISVGDTWNANTLNMGNLNATNVEYLNFPSAGVEGYLEAGYLFEEEVDAYADSNDDPDGLYNWAVWDLLTNSDVSASNLSSSQETQVQIYLNDAESMGSSFTPSEFSNVVIYTPTEMDSGGPQEFFGYDTPVPEPSTFALLGIGAVGLLRRRRSAAHLAPIALTIH